PAAQGAASGRHPARSDDAGPQRLGVPRREGAGARAARGAGGADDRLHRARTAAAERPRAAHQAARPGTAPDDAPASLSRLAEGRGPLRRTGPRATPRAPVLWNRWTKTSWRKRWP